MNIDRSAIMFGVDGAWSRENSPEFLTSLGDPAPDYDASRFAISNLGFVRLAFIESLVEITLCPRTVEANAMSAMLKMLAASGAVVVRIRICRGEETIRFFRAGSAWHHGRTDSTSAVDSRRGNWGRVSREND